MITIKLNYPYFLAIIIFIISCSYKMKERRIKSIEYYRLEGQIDPNKSDEIFKIRVGIYKVENFDTNGNLIRENGFDREMNPDNVIEYKFDVNNNLIEKMMFKNYHNQPLTKTYLSKYIYKNNLLTEILHYYGTFDSIGFWARNTISYNEKKQKIRDEFASYNDEATKETRIYDWKDENRYIEDRIDKEGNLAERHFVRLDKRRKELEHRINFELASKDDYTYHVYYEKEFDEYGNETVGKNKFVGKQVQKTVYKYFYDNGNWIYRLEIDENNKYWTEFRKIAYY